MTFTAAGLSVMPAAQAQQQSPSGPSATTPSPTTTPTIIPDKKLDAAAAAVKKVSVIKNKYDQQLAEAPVAEKERLQGEAGNAMAKAWYAASVWSRAATRIDCSGLRSETPTRMLRCLPVFSNRMRSCWPSTSRIGVARRRDHRAMRHGRRLEDWHSLSEANGNHIRSAASSWHASPPL